MIYRNLLAVAVIFAAAFPAFAQDWQFRFAKGQTLTYKIKHVTTIVEIVDTTKNIAESQVDIVNRWQVLDVDAKGIATLQLTLVAMRNEQKRPNGETLLFDSQNPGKSTPELVEQMKKFIGSTVAVVTVDGHGRVHEVKQGSAANFEAEPPFLVVFPAAKPTVNQAWRRPFQLVLDPPYGTGEKYEAEQRYDCKKLEAGKATLGISTHFKTMPDNMSERIPLLQKDVQGLILFDVQGGRLLSAQLNIDKTVENHQGKGSSYQLKSQYTRQLVQ
jgi:hypothetical protein